MFGKRSRAKRIGTYILIGLVVVTLVAVSVRFGALLVRRISVVNGSRTNIVKIWNEGDYARVLDVTEANLRRNPLDSLSLTFAGMSSYYLSQASGNMDDKIDYLDRSISYLRRRLDDESASRYEAPSAYILGKAYHNKGEAYANLVVKYLTMAGAHGFYRKDMDEYFGLAYIRLGEYEKGIDFFLKAGSGERNSNFYYNLALAYALSGKQDRAEFYYRRVIDSSKDDNLRDKASFELAHLYYKTGRYSDSKGLYNALLVKYPDNSSAHFYLGEVFRIMGDNAAARREWTEAVRLDPLNREAFLRLYD